MMGQRTRSESPFYFFRLEDHVPENHLLRLIDRHIRLAFVRETVRPSIDPELLLRILLIGYLYGITSERKLVEELRCTWRGAGLLAWDSIRRFRTTPRSPRTGTGASRSPSCSNSSSSRSARGAWRQD